MLERAEVAEQCSLGNRQPFEFDSSPAEPQQRLHKREIQRRRDRVSAVAGEVPHERVRDTNHEFAGCREATTQLQIVGQRQQAAIASGFFRAAKTAIDSPAAEELSVVAKAFAADVQRRQVQRFELLVIVRRMNPRELDCIFQLEPHHAVGVRRHVLNELLAPGRILQPVGHSAVQPAVPGFHSVNRLHVFVRLGIVLRHRRRDGVVHVRKPAPRIHIDAVIRDVPC